MWDIPTPPRFPERFGKNTECRRGDIVRNKEAVYDNPVNTNHLFSKTEMKNKIDLSHLRALRTQRIYVHRNSNDWQSFTGISQAPHLKTP